MWANAPLWTPPVGQGEVRWGITGSGLHASLRPVGAQACAGPAGQAGPRAPAAVSPWPWGGSGVPKGRAVPLSLPAASWQPGGRCSSLRGVRIARERRTRGLRRHLIRLPVRSEGPENAGRRGGQGHPRPRGPPSLPPGRAPRTLAVRAGQTALPHRPGARNQEGAQLDVAGGGEPAQPEGQVPLFLGN